MRMLVGFIAALLLAGSMYAQSRANYSNPTPVVRGGVGSAVFPGGTPANSPGIQRFTPSVIYPGGGGPRLVIPNATNVRQQHRGTFGGTTGGYIYSYPVYVGGSYGSVYDSSAYAAEPQPQAQQPNVTIVMPPQQPPVVINQFDSVPHPQMSVYQPETAPAPAAHADDSAPEPARYLLAFKDHTIYSAVAYWVDGDTLHYFTSGNTHNQVSVSLIDRPLTERLNKDAGVDVKLPPVK
jgi:hypothetical protein